MPLTRRQFLLGTTALIASALLPRLLVPLLRGELGTLEGFRFVGVDLARGEDHGMAVVVEFTKDLQMRIRDAFAVPGELLAECDYDFRRTAARAVGDSSYLRAFVCGDHLYGHLAGTLDAPDGMGRVGGSSMGYAPAQMLAPGYRPRRQGADGRRGKAARMKIDCPYCGYPAELVDGQHIYPHRHDLAERKFWLCAPCDAYVGTHENSPRNAPLGRLANPELRKAKVRAHSAFDPLWRAKIRKDGWRKGKARAAGYRWLAAQLGIDPKDCHIGKFDVAMCRRVVEVCKPYHRSEVRDDQKELPLARA